MAKHRNQLGDKTAGGTVIAVAPAGTEHQVVTIKGNPGSHMKKPCATCPWRKDATEAFPAEAFRHSANTAQDMASHTFGCHQSGTGKPKTCAGFLLKGADHNITVRIGRVTGRYTNDVTDGGHELHESYRAMAIANGVHPEDTALQQCRP